MCGRYASSRRPEDLVEQFEIDILEDALQRGEEGAPNYNVAPTQSAMVVLERAPRPAEESGAPAGDDSEGEATSEAGDAAGGAVGGGVGSGRPEREPEAVRWLRDLTWGLVPSWSKDRSGGARMINARSESLLEKPAYRRPALLRRCLVPADGWYEWQVSPTAKDAKGKPRKQPFFVRLDSGESMAMAGVYELWRDPAKHADDPDAWLATYAIVTTAAEPGLDVIHDRMPLVLPQERWDAWLDPENREADDVRVLLEPPPPGRFTAVAISSRVNSVRNNGPELLAALPVEELHGVVDPATGELIGAGADPLF